MNTSAKTIITIHAPATDVFRYLVGLRYHFLWNPHLQSVNPPDLLTLKKGSEYNTSTLMFGVKVKATNRITKCVQDKLLSIENDTGLLHYTIEYVLEAAAKHTKLTCVVEVQADSKAFAFAKPVLKPLAQRELQSDLESLKFAVEQGLEIE